MALVNIGEDNKNDGFYRYKMPKLITKIEGRGNGIKTNIVNMVDVAKALARPPAYTTKYFGCVLGAQSKFEEKTGTSTVNGAHETAKLVQHLEGFIKTYVQCYGCGNPETEVIITKNQCITLKCAACGHVSDVDMRDKLTTFILKNPPEQKKKKGSKDMRRAEKERLKAGEEMDKESKKLSKEGSGKKKGDEKVKKSKKKRDEDDSEKGSSQKDEDSAEDAAGNDEEDDDVEWQTDTSADAAKQRIQEQLSAVTASMVMVSTEEKPLNGTSTHGTNGKNSEQRPADVPSGVDVGEDEEEEGEDDDEEEPSPHELLVADLADYVKTHNLSEVASYVKKKGTTEGVLAALLEVLFEGISKGFAKEVVKKKAAFLKTVDSADLQLVLLAAIEHFFATAAKAAGKEVALVLKAMYDEDILEEEQIFAWFNKTGASTLVGPADAAIVRKHADPFVKWLKEAEEDDDE